jgi:hypothetical protein
MFGLDSGDEGRGFGWFGRSGRVLSAVIFIRRDASLEAELLG